MVAKKKEKGILGKDGGGCRKVLSLPFERRLFFGFFFYDVLSSLRRNSFSPARLTK